MTALLIILAIVLGLALLALLGRGVWWFCEVGFPAFILFLMKHF